MASEMSNENNTKELQKIEGENVAAAKLVQVQLANGKWINIRENYSEYSSQNDAQAGANEIESLMPKHDNCCHGHHHKKHWKIGKFGQGPLQFPLMLSPPGGTTPDKEL